MELVFSTWTGVASHQGFPARVGVRVPRFGTKKDTIVVRATERRDGVNRIVIINLVHVGDYEVQDVVTSSRGVD
jgi:hypothetical protein